MADGRTVSRSSRLGRSVKAAATGVLLGGFVVLVAACAAHPGADAAPRAGAVASSASSVAPAAPTTTAAPTAAVPAGTASAQTALATALVLEVKGRAPKTGYSREQFGSAWKDTDHNGCDQRNDVLGRDLTAVSLKAGSCVVLTGSLADPYSGRTIAFQRGEETSSAVQIDHVVALSDAWQKGAQGWDAGTRERFANDVINLLAADGPLNMQKGDGDTATWLPPYKAFRCAYVARQVGVKYAYGLWVTAAEQDAMVSVLSSCPGEPLPAGVAGDARPVVLAPAEGLAPAGAPAPAVVAPGAVTGPAPAGVHYASCAAVRAAGAAPIHRDDAGFEAKFDRDDDGVGCE